MSIMWWAVIGVVALVGGYIWYAVNRPAQNSSIRGAGRHRRPVAAAARPHSERSHHRAPVHGSRAGLLAEITELRTKAHRRVGERDFAKVGEKFEPETRLSQQMGRLLMLAENYPQLSFRRPDDRGAAHLHRDRDQHRCGAPVLQRERELAHQRRSNFSLAPPDKWIRRRPGSASLLPDVRCDTDANRRGKHL